MTHTRNTAKCLRVASCNQLTPPHPNASDTSRLALYCSQVGEIIVGLARTKDLAGGGGQRFPGAQGNLYPKSKNSSDLAHYFSGDVFFGMIVVFLEVLSSQFVIAKITEAVCCMFAVFVC